MKYNILYHPKVEEDMKSLDNNVQLMVLKKIKKLSEQPELGQPLGNKAGMNLTGYKKIYVCNKQIRIIYKINKDKIEIYIIAIGKRDYMEIYKEANKRISNK